MEVRVGWCIFFLVINEVFEDVLVIIMDYCNLFIRCCFYLSIDYLVKECRGIWL